MKRALSLLIAMTLLVFPACQERSIAPEQKTLRVVATVFPSYDFVKQLAGERVYATLLIPPGAESHTYEPSPQDIISISECDLFIYTGGESDHWVETVLSSLENQPKTFRLMEHIKQPLDEAETAEHQAAHDHDGHAPVYDEHVWTSLRNVVQITDALLETLSALEPAQADAFRFNAEAYKQALQTLDASFTELFKSAKTNVLVFGDRYPFRYFAADYGLTCYAAFPGCGTKSEPSAATIASLIDKVNELHLPVVFYVNQSSHLVADTIADQVGVSTQLLHACHNVTQQELEAGETYLSLMEKNLAALQTAYL